MPSRTEQLRRQGAKDRTERAHVPVPSRREVERAGHDANSARELMAASVGEDPYERVEDMRRAGERKARAEGVYYQLDHGRKGILARLASEYAHTHADKNLSEAKLERLARADERYRKHIEGTAAALEEKELAHSEYWAIRSELEWDRAALAHLNAMSRLGEPS